jgi:hypothetical protein
MVERDETDRHRPRTRPSRLEARPIAWPRQGRNSRTSASVSGQEVRGDLRFEGPRGDVADEAKCPWVIACGDRTDPTTTGSLRGQCPGGR